MQVRCGPSALVVGTLVAAFSVGAEQPAEIQASWPQFRGVNACGVSHDESPLPVEFGRENALWATPLPPGHSSPCIWGDRVFLTGFDREAGRLETFCLDRHSGEILWRRPAPANEIEKVHPISTPANATPATDGERVYVYFGSFGLLCYDFTGRELWQLPQPAPLTPYGSGSSPIVADEYVVLSCEQPPRPVVLAVDRRTGREAWRHACLPYLPGYATPVVWDHDETREVILHTSVGVTALRLQDGSRQWWVSMLSAASSTPAVAPDRLFVAACWPGGEPQDRVPLPEFDQAQSRYDADGDGEIDRQELPADLLIVRRAEVGDILGAEIPLARAFNFFDADGDGRYDRAEWARAVEFSRRGREHGLLAVRPGGQGDVTHSHVMWRESRSVAEVPSPLVYRGQVYMIKDGGIVSCLEAASGRLLYRTRLGPRGAYFASPVAGDGKIYAASCGGVVTVLAAGETFQVLAGNDLREPIFATPAIAAGKLYIRTEQRLYAFGPINPKP
ncbi:MAG TPA: PQQ-binding-like beta-propeller repeat protein [Candidatus Anammoximicrobium sp.]|nr:PQQ-binding-like beta-propeller repeat protein [Candidatus Anammoximicrobium sp.]